MLDKPLLQVLHSPEFSAMDYLQCLSVKLLHDALWAHQRLLLEDPRGKIERANGNYLAN